MSKKKKDLLIGLIRKYMAISGYADYKVLASALGMSFLGLLSAAGYCGEGSLAIGDYLAIALVLFGVMTVCARNIVRRL